MTITQNLLEELFDYQDGNLYWKVSRRNGVKIGDIAGSDREDGYRGIKINGKRYLTHRLIFLYHHDYLPKSLDHIDGNRSNNDINNLREATFSQNQHNRKKGKFYCGKPTSSIYKGVHWNKRNKKWVTKIVVNTKPKHLGYYDSEIDAALAYDRAAIKYHGEFAVTNKSLGLLP